MLESLHDLPIVGDVRGAGYFHAIELVKDKETKESFNDEESEQLLRGFLSGELYKRGLICRADDRGDPVVQLAPPLIADTEQFEEIHDVLRAVLGRGLGPGGRRAEDAPVGAPVLTVQSLLDELDLELAAGADAAAAPVRWVHISELEDPTPWLSGGELMLTTGIPLDTAAKQRAFIRLLADRNLAGLGFGTGFNHKSLPKALVDEAEKRDFPLFEVPYSMPFIAITEKAFARLVNEQYEVLQRGIAVQRRLERLVLEERGPGGNRRHRRLRRRRHRRGPRRPRRAARRQGLPPPALGRGDRRDPQGSARATPATATPSSPRTPTSPGGRWPTR